MQETEGISLEQISGIIRRQKNLFIALFIITWLAAIALALFLPPVYRANTTILIEEQQIPQEFVRTTITSYVEERLQIITQQIMSRPRLKEIIDRFTLYPKMKKRHTHEEIIERLRKDISLQTVSADVVDRRTGRPSTATIAFNLAYEGKNPNTVARVTNRLASLYLEENLRQREKRVTNITSFLRQERNELAKQINELEEKLSRFKQKHGRELPEFNNVNLQAVNRLSRDLEQNHMQLSSLHERKLYLEGQLASIDPQLNSTPLRSDEGRLLLPPAERLKSLRLQLLSLKSRYSNKHPDIIKTKREIAELEAQEPDQVSAVAELEAKQEQLEILNRRQKKLEGKLGAKHPDRVSLSKEISSLKLEIEKSSVEIKNRDPKTNFTAKSVTNPAYINIQVQIKSASLEIAALKASIQRNKQKFEEYQLRLENAPLVERDYKRMIRELEQAQFRNADVIQKLTEAQVAQEMEESQQGERFTIIDPALTPERPAKPNRLAIALIGFVLALGLATGVAALRENLNTTIKNSADLARLTGLPILSTMPVMENNQERRRRRLRYAFIILFIVGTLATALAAIHFYYLPLDIVWIKIMRRMGI
ncbi:hypothetical protein KAI46_03765 [bacterium]|nr:hypothetical protein [bacterium]